MSEQPYHFSFNWTSWPFVEAGDQNAPDLRNILDAQLQVDLKKWSQFMLENFDEEDGFKSLEAAEAANKQYENLCERLRNSGLTLTTANWWS
jgi:hypothetical protein